MARLARAEIFDPAEIVAVHLIGKTVRSCYLMGVDERSGKNFDHRKRWLEEKLKHLAANFGSDILAFSCMPNHVHAIVQFREGYDFDTIGQSWMRFTARVINKQIGRTGVLWQPEPFDHIIRRTEQFCYLRRYIADNPKKASLRDGEYIYWKRTL